MISTNMQRMIDEALPIGVYSYIRRPRGTVSITVIYCDWDHTVKYFEKDYYLAGLTPSQSMTVLMEDVAKFKETWNSPLAKTMRETDDV